VKKWLQLLLQYQEEASIRRRKKNTAEASQPVLGTDTTWTAS